MFKKNLALLGAAMTMAFSPLTFAGDVDPALPDYEKVSGISGSLSSVGSDTLANLMTMWAEERSRWILNTTAQSLFQLWTGLP